MKRSMDKLQKIVAPPPVDLPEARLEIPEVPTDLTADLPTLKFLAIPAYSGPSKTEERILQHEEDECTKRKKILPRNLENLYPLIWG